MFTTCLGTGLKIMRLRDNYSRLQGIVWMTAKHKELTPCSRFSMTLRTTPSTLTPPHTHTQHTPTHSTPPRTAHPHLHTMYIQ